MPPPQRSRTLAHRLRARKARGGATAQAAAAEGNGDERDSRAMRPGAPRDLDRQRHDGDVRLAAPGLRREMDRPWRMGRRRRGLPAQRQPDGGEQGAPARRARGARGLRRPRAADVPRRRLSRGARRARAREPGPGDAARHRGRRGSSGRVWAEGSGREVAIGAGHALAHQRPALDAAEIVRRAMEAALACDTTCGGTIWMVELGLGASDPPRPRRAPRRRREPGGGGGG